MMSIGEASGDSILLQDGGDHVFKEIWTPRLGEILLVSQEAGNVHNKTCGCSADSGQIMRCCTVTGRKHVLNKSICA